MITPLVIFFWLSAAFVFYSYAGYPALLRLFAALFGRPVRCDGGHAPSVAVVIPVYNEEKVIAKKIENVLALDYPPQLLTVWVGSDASTDRTHEIVRGFSDPRIRLWIAPRRGGKTEILNNVVPQTGSDIVFFTDANTMHRADSLKKMVACYADPAVGAVAGHIDHLTGGAGEEEEEVFYRSFESRQKELESRLHSAIAAFGGFYTIRRSLFSPIPFNAYSNDDVMIPMNVIRRKCRVIFCRQAVSYEDTSQSTAVEFRRRIRIGAGNFQAFFWLADFLNPLQGWPWFCYVSHKVTRWFSPFFLLLAVVSACGLAAARPLSVYALAAWCGAGAVAAGLSSRFLPFKSTRHLFYFILMNAALIAGFFRYCRGIRSAAWDRTQRSQG